MVSAEAEPTVISQAAVGGATPERGRKIRGLTAPRKADQVPEQHHWWLSKDS
jgi:hypothetical protein